VSEPPDRQAIEALLGADLVRLLADRMPRLVAVVPVSSAPSALDGTAAFRLEFADGAVLKGRRVRSPRRAEAVEQLVDLAGRGFQPVRARQGLALLTDWIEGRVLSSFEPSLDLVRQCGAVLAKLHQVAIPDATRRRPDANRALLNLKQDLGVLESAQAIDAAFADRAIRLATGRMPGDASAGVIHNDFCAENIVLGAGGEVTVIDNATITIGLHDMDLARTWLRWPMAPHLGTAFLTGYRTGRGPDSFLEHFAFWAVCALSRAAANRLTRQMGGVGGRVEQLATFLRRGGEASTETGWPAPVS
jgi:Ser/Thr protein kinase RdoA (MazF antagonist)